MWKSSDPFNASVAFTRVWFARLPRPRSFRLGVVGLGLLLAACSSDPVAAPATVTTAEPDAASSTSEQSTSEVEPTPDSTTTTTTIPAGTAPLERIPLELIEVGTAVSPVDLFPRPGSDDIFIVEQPGRLLRWPNGDPANAETLLDISRSVSNGNEQGLLGAVFDTAGERLFINYTDRSGDTVIDAYDYDELIDPASAQTLLTIPQNRANHNGGGVELGPDGFLYIGLGDGGGGGDPERNGQNPNTLHGSILRIDPTSDGYEVPADNPFVDGGGAAEVFVWGVRNGWRFSFDPATGDLWIGDVGQDRYEEVSVLRASEGGGNGANLGWNLFEGDTTFRSGEEPASYVAPITVYPHTGGRCSVTGGETYWGEAIPQLRGTYLYGDFCSGEVFGLRTDGASGVTILDLPAIGNLSSFGVDASGEVYVLSRRGTIYRLTAG